MEIADTLFIFEGDVWKNISDVNRAASIIHAEAYLFKRSSVSGDFFL